MAKKESKKTNACRVLDALKISYRLVTYDVDETDLSASSVAAKVGLPVEQVFKTLCLRANDGDIVLAVLPGDRELDMKALARAADKKSVAPVAVRELPDLTGYVRGGVTALGSKKTYPVYVDELAQLYDTISVSAGQRGLQLWLSPGDYIRATRAKLVDVSREGAA